MSIDMTIRVILLGGLAALIFIAFAMGQDTYGRPRAVRPQRRSGESRASSRSEPSLHPPLKQAQSDSSAR